MKVFKLFSNCIPVKGARRCVISDLSRGQIFFISQGLFQFLTEYKDLPYQKILDEHSDAIKKALGKEIEFLLENELGFFTDKPNDFPDLDLSWFNPSKITNAIIEHDKTSDYNLDDLFFQLDELGCQFIELRFYDSYALHELEDFMNYVGAHTSINSINIHIKYSNTWNRSDILRILALFPRIAMFNVFGTDFDVNEEEKKFDRISYTETVIVDNSYCGNIGYDYFSINTQSFTEAQNFNSCLNRKVSISPSGGIKNCPSLPETYGTINEVSLKQAISGEFKKYWSLKKDDIEVCKDCEFRYSCLDCRAYTTNSDNLLSKPEKCSYDPYTAKWE